MQIPDKIRKCVVFVCYQNDRGVQLAGTAFSVGYLIPELGQRGDLSFRIVYFITAKHVIEHIRTNSNDNKVLLKMNTEEKAQQQGKPVYLKIPIEEWLYHPADDNVDVAVFNYAFPQDYFEYEVFPVEMAATEAVAKKEEIGVGDDVFLTGLFANHPGLDRNIPIVRVGNIAAMPEEKVHTKAGEIDAYLIEARSIGGLSGSPVFVHMGSIRKTRKGKELMRSGPEFYWLGIMHGHFDKTSLELDSTKADTLVNLAINMGIAIVVPVWKVLEVINQEFFIKRRNQVIQTGTKHIV